MAKRVVSLVVFLCLVLLLISATNASKGVVLNAECAAGCEMFKIMLRQNREWYNQCYYDCTHPWKPPKTNVLADDYDEEVWEEDEEESL